MSRPQVFRIDIHHHFFPSSLKKEKSNVDVGWRTPAENMPWTPAVSLKFMEAAGIDFTVLSLPALAGGEVGPADRALARERNHYVSDICHQHPDKLSFFASLPTLDDVEGALTEISYSLDVLKAEGIALPSSCGAGVDAKYIGDDRYDPIWKELSRRCAVVFLHGTQTASSTPHPHAFLGIPVVEVPNETFKAAAHLVVTGRKRAYPDVKIILAHMGGTMPFLAARVAVLSRHMGCTLTPEDVLQDFKTFYFDTALSAHETTLTAMQSFCQPEQILFGTDFPAVSAEMTTWFTRNVEDFFAGDVDKLNGVMSSNALKLFPGLRARLRASYMKLPEVDTT